MRRLLSFCAGFVLVLCAVSVSAPVLAGIYANEGAAFSACVSYMAGYNQGPSSCVFYPASAGSPTVAGGVGVCASNLLSGSSYYVDGGFRYQWCVSASCPVGPVGDSVGYNPAMASAPKTDGAGCCVTFVSSGAASYNGLSYISGSDSRTGGYCSEDYGSTDSVGGGVSKLCGGGSCYDAKSGMACYTTDSGEQICKKVGGAEPGGCVVGATGAACYGTGGAQPPPPPDPPIAPGTSAAATGSGQEKDGSGNVTSNYTTNFYSGTSPGTGGEGAGSQSSGYSGSNSNGDGNSGKNGNGPASGSTSASSGGGQCPTGGSPTASGCSGTYSDSGCNTPPQCFGDAVLCGIAVNTHETSCKIAAAGSTAGLPAGSGDGTDNSGDPTASAVSSSVDLGDGSTLDASGFGYATSCPLTDLSFTVMGQSVDVPLSSMCDWISVIRYIVLAMAYFLAAKIIAGVR